ncbi:MAG: DUF2752 domain-containing protein [Oscillospiraceae bacterium]|nr:DUF2752 domain-containing protein [Oscillospiraceae bacterium]
MKTKISRKEVLDKLQILLVIGVAVTLLAVSGIGCPIRFLFGVPCPGCGITRAWMSALHGNIADAFRWHPLFLVATASVVYISVGRRPLFGSDRAESVFIVTFSVAMLAIWLIRVIFGENLGLFDIDGGEGYVVNLIKQIFLRGVLK